MNVQWLTQDIEGVSAYLIGLSPLLQQVQQTIAEIQEENFKKVVQELEDILEEASSKHEQTAQKKRKQHDPMAVATLTEWLEKHASNPYPSFEDKQELSDKTGMTVSQVETWFANTRRRKKN